jgi:hypothetical protein
LVSKSQDELQISTQNQSTIPKKHNFKNSVLNQSLGIRENNIRRLKIMICEPNKITVELKLHIIISVSKDSELKEN